MKDNFSRQSAAYAQFRPAYPPELYDCIYSKVKNFERAWDCATGNGQVAGVLADRFREVFATDISQKQLDQAVRKANIHYSLQAAETADFPEHFFDLITVGQAVHWFDHGQWYQKVHHCLRPGGILAEFGYSLFRMDKAVNRVMDRFYTDIIGPYWDPERKHINEAYGRIPFPLEPIETPDLSMQYEWTLDETLGYLSTWSSVQHFLREKGSDPVALIQEELVKAWGNSDTKKVSFQIILRIGTN